MSWFYLYNSMSLVTFLINVDITLTRILLNTANWYNIFSVPTNFILIPILNCVSYLIPQVIALSPITFSKLMQVIFLQLNYLISAVGIGKEASVAQDSHQSVGIFSSLIRYISSSFAIDEEWVSFILYLIIYGFLVVVVLHICAYIYFCYVYTDEDALASGISFGITPDNVWYMQSPNTQGWKPVPDFDRFGSFMYNHLQIVDNWLQEVFPELKKLRNCPNLNFDENGSALDY